MGVDEYLQRYMLKEVPISYRAAQEQIGYYRTLKRGPNRPPEPFRRVAKRKLGTKNYKYKFRHEVDNKVSFSCVLETTQCAYRNAAGKRCNRYIAYGLPVCWLHLQAVYGLRIGQRLRSVPTSEHRLRPGVRNADIVPALFAVGEAPNVRVFKNGDFIVPVIGKLLNADERKKRRKTMLKVRKFVEPNFENMERYRYVKEDMLRLDPYIRFAHRHFDAACVRGAATFARPAIIDGEIANAVIVRDARLLPFLRAVRDIHDGDEILLEPDDWMRIWGEDESFATTTPKLLPNHRPWYAAKRWNNEKEDHYRHRPLRFRHISGRKPQPASMPEPVQLAPAVAAHNRAQAFERLEQRRRDAQARRDREAEEAKQAEDRQPNPVQVPRGSIGHLAPANADDLEARLRDWEIEDRLGGGPGGLLGLFDAEGYD